MVDDDSRTAILPYGLLYSRDADSTDFPLTEIKRACCCFRRRRELVGLEPALVHLHPSHLPLVNEEQLGLTVKADIRLGRQYIWLLGRPKANDLTAEAQDGLPG